MTVRPKRSVSRLATGDQGILREEHGPVAEPGPGLYGISDAREKVLGVAGRHGLERARDELASDVDRHFATR